MSPQLLWLAAHSEAPLAAQVQNSVTLFFDVSQGIQTYLHPQRQGSSVFVHSTLMSPA